MDPATRILQHIRKTTSRAPARADQVFTELKIEPAVGEAALQQLLRIRLINTAHIHRPAHGERFLALWPTGITVEAGGWCGNSHSALFSADTPRRFPARPDPTRDPRPDLCAPVAAPQVAPAGPAGQAAPAHESARPMARTGNAAGVSRHPATTQEPTMPNPQPRARGQLALEAVALLAGVRRDAAMTCQQLGDLLDVRPGNLPKVLDKQVAHHCLARTTVENPHARGPRQIPAYYDPATDGQADEPGQKPAPASDAPGLQPGHRTREPDATPVPRTDTAGADTGRTRRAVHIGLSDDGALILIDGDETMLIPPGLTARIARLLAAHPPAGGAPC